MRGGLAIMSALPDQEDVGTLAIPTTVGLVSGGRNTEPAKKLIDYLLSADVERQLLQAKFAGWSVRGGGGEGEPAKWMDVDYREVARVMPRAVREVNEILQGR